MRIFSSIGWGLIVENPFDREWSVNPDVSCIWCRNHNKSVVFGHEESFFTLALDPPSCADLQLNNTDIRFFQSLVKLFRLEGGSRFAAVTHLFGLVAL